jgi:hypothetical protein
LAGAWSSSGWYRSRSLDPSPSAPPKAADEDDDADDNDEDEEEDDEDDEDDGLTGESEVVASRRARSMTSSSSPSVLSSSPVERKILSVPNLQENVKNIHKHTMSASIRTQTQTHIGQTDKDRQAGWVRLI